MRTEDNRNDENIVLFFTVLLVLATLGTMVHFYTSRQKMEREAYLSSSVETAQSLVVLMNYNNDFSAALQTATMYSLATPFKVKLTNFIVRNPEHKPDDWELRAMDDLTANPLKPYVYEYDPKNSDADSPFRFLAPLRANVGCLQCHGDPVGELDVTGYPKEGLKLGDFAGAISIQVEGDYLAEFSKYQRFSLVLALELVLMGILFAFYLWRVRFNNR